MRLVWTEPARQDVNAIWQYLSDRNPHAAEMVDSVILKSVEALLPFPRRGRPGRVAGTRELVLPELPYLIVYGVGTAEIVIYRVVHAARDVGSWVDSSGSSGKD